MIEGEADKTGMDYTKENAWSSGHEKGGEDLPWQPLPIGEGDN